MKVKCIKLFDSDGREVEFSPWLTVGRIYHVMGISIGADGQRRYQIVSHDCDPGFATLAYQRAEAFEVVSTQVPSNWRIRVGEDGAIGIAPGAWQKVGFFEAFYEQDPSAYSIFEQARDSILSEDP